jgi:acetylornithine deacetylase
MTSVLSALKEYQQDVARTRASHPRVGSPTLSVGVIRGGLSVNTVPDRCTIEIDRRLVPGEEWRTAWEDVIRFVSERQLAGHTVQHDDPFLIGYPLPDDHNRELAELLAKSVRETTGQGQIWGVPYGTDAAVFARAGVPSVVFGPGSLDQAHTVDEWVSLDEVRLARNSLLHFLRSLTFSQSK